MGIFIIRNYGSNMHDGICHSHRRKKRHRNVDMYLAPDFCHGDGVCAKEKDEGKRDFMIPFLIFFI
jgi:hypothetical protein